jgi:hypothetical protein
LAILVVVLLAPWAVLAGVYAFSRSAPDASSPTAPASVRPGSERSAGGSVGPWGELTTTPVVISPPIEYVPAASGPVRAPEWYLPNVSLDEFRQLLRLFGMPPNQSAELLAATRPVADIRGLTARPGADLVRALSPEIRAKLYATLAHQPLNAPQYEAYRYPGTSVGEWLGSNIVSPETTRLVESLAYRHNGFTYFADLDVIRPAIADPAERQRLVKVLHRTPAMLIRVRVDDPRTLDALAEYWGRGGRRTDIRPLLDSLASEGGDQTIDISHLLPTFARTQLYRFPRVSAADFDRASNDSGLWTALNFFNAEPDDRLRDDDYALRQLRDQYYIIQNNLQLGDVVVFSDQNGRVFHSAVYVADDLVFGQHRSGPLSPWTIMPMSYVRRYYGDRVEAGRTFYYRPNQF